MLDNAKVHKVKEVLEPLLNLLESKGVRSVFQPTYSPELNGAELYFGWIKKKMKFSPGSNLRQEVFFYLNSISLDLAVSFCHKAMYEWLS